MIRKKAVSKCYSRLLQLKGAVNGLMNELIESHLRQHVIGDEVEVNEVKLNEFLKLLKRYT